MHISPHSATQHDPFTLFKVSEGDKSIVKYLWLFSSHTIQHEEDTRNLFCMRIYFSFIQLILIHLIASHLLVFF